MRKWIIILMIIVIAAVFGYNYIYQDHRDIKNESAEFVITSLEIALQFSENPDASEQKFLNKTIEISGLISEINSKDLTLNDKVFCQFTTTYSEAKLNEKLKIKGRVIGYDDLLEQVKLDQCAIIK